MTVMSIAAKRMDSGTAGCTGNSCKVDQKKLKKIVGGKSDDDGLRTAQEQAVRFSNERRCNT